jgi:hypothetical protein
MQQQHPFHHAQAQHPHQTQQQQQQQQQSFQAQPLESGAGGGYGRWNNSGCGDQQQQQQPGYQHQNRPYHGRWPQSQEQSPQVQQTAYYPMHAQQRHQQQQRERFQQQLVHLQFKLQNQARYVALVNNTSTLKAKAERLHFQNSGVGTDSSNAKSYVEVAPQDLNDVEFWRTVAQKVVNVEDSRGLHTSAVVNDSRSCPREVGLCRREVGLAPRAPGTPGPDRDQVQFMQACFLNLACPFIGS